MQRDFDGLRTDIVHLLGGEHIRVSTRSFQNDMCSLKVKNDVLALLIHLGYLGYDSDTQQAFIPNREIMEEFENAMSVGGWPQMIDLLKSSEQLLQDTLSGNAECAAKALDKVHSQAASILTYNDENSFSCAIRLAYYSARKDYKLFRELPAGKGFADTAFLPLPHTNQPALLIELKYNGSARAAVRQMKDRQYTQAFEGYTGSILLVGIRYDKHNLDKPHSCIIEKIQKRVKQKAFRDVNVSGALWRYQGLLSKTCSPSFCASGCRF